MVQKWMVKVLIIQSSLIFLFCIWKKIGFVSFISIRENLLSDHQEWRRTCRMSVTNLACLDASESQEQ